MREAPDLRIGGWLALGYGVAALLLAALASIALVLLARIERQERTQFEEVRPRAEAAARLERDLLSVAIAVRAYALAPDDGRRDAVERALERARSARAVLARIPKTPEGEALATGAGAAVDGYLSEAATYVRRVGEGGPTAAEASLAVRREATLERVRSFAELQARQALDASAALLELRRAASRTLAATTVALLALLGATALVVTRRVRRPAVELAAAARLVAAGDYAAAAGWAAPGDPPRRNELAELRRAFGRMAADLRDREERIAAQHEELQAQNEELQAQHEELQAQQEELQGQNEELQAQQEELQAQQEELQAQNEELQAQAQQLRAQEERLQGALERLGAAAAALREADRRKDEFIATLSHELRNPLAPILSGLNVVERAEPGSEAAVKARAIIRRQVTHLTRLVDDLLDVTRVRSGKVNLRRSHVELAALVRHATEDHAATLAARGVALDVRIPPAPLWVHADPARLGQVLGNLLHNAAKFTPAGGRVTVVLEAAGPGRAALRVRDTGCGIPPEVLPSLFQPFSQAERSLARTEGGLGLGLALVKGLVELHGGTVSAASDGEGRGAELTVELPLYGVAPAVEEAPATAPARAPRRVLIVEDNVDGAESLAELLRLHGHEVAVAHDGAAGLHAALASAPDVVLCDLGLPGLDGYEVARRLREEDRLAGTLLVALTGYAGADDVRRATAAGFDAHLTKPASPEEIEALLHRGRAPLYAGRGSG